LSANPNDAAAMAQFKAHEKDLGYGFLAQRYSPEQDVSKATDADIARAAKDTIPEVSVIFWAFRLMVGLGLAMLAYFIIASMFSLNGRLEKNRWFLKLAVWMIPVPFLAAEMGWLVAEIGRQPWTVFGMLPTWMSASTHSVGYMIFSLVGFVGLYSIFIAVEMYLMVKAIKQGPEEHGTPAAPQSRKPQPSLGGGFAAAAAAPMSAHKEN
jgi:cytochrome d ubiquinol oxidase subunit I